ncbi:hypothetical protein L0222_15420 [bacterium]|nr:hypothetical protein [bacterium]
MSLKILTVLLVSLLAVSFSSASVEEEKGPRQPKMERVTGKIETVRPNSMTVRVGDATKTFSFDNKTVFTHGDHRGKVGDLKIGDEVFANVTKGKAAEVNGTERLEGIIEQIDAVKKELIVKVGDQQKKIPFRYFMAFSSEGKTASYTDMKVGDAVLLNVNVGFADEHPDPTANPKKP